MDKNHLVNYARLIARKGLNVQKGQDVNLYCGMDQMEFIHILVEELYLAGARKVFISWNDPETRKLDNKYQELEALSTVETFEKAKAEYQRDHICCRLFIDSESPDSMKGMDMDKAIKARIARSKILKPINDAYEDKEQWCIAGVPGPEWAKKVFPNLSEEEAVEALWVAILKVSRAYDGDPLENWEIHDAKLQEKIKVLNSLKLTKLHYTSNNGTDFTVDLSTKIKWCAGGKKTKESKTYFQPNIPTEECFTTPIKGKCEGKVVSAKPLSLQGNLVEDFYFIFKDGKVSDLHARVGEEHLRNLIKMDEGSKMLGECALIPFDSPINNTNILFFNTLYDENASCHLALGMGFSNLVEGYEKMTDKEIEEIGVNDSINHVDFMIGSKDLNIVGTDEKGIEHQIFKNGNWAF